MIAAGRDMNVLIDAFDTFTKASTTLESYYRELEKRVEALDLELAEKNNFLTGILEGLPVGIIVLDRSGVVKTANRISCEILKEGLKNLIGKTLEPWFGSIDADFYKILSARNVMREGEYEIPLALRDDKKTIAVNGTLLKNLHGDETGYLIVLKDISEIKRLRETAQREKRLTAMGEMAASIAHQIRNPLGSIELYASLLSEELKEDVTKQRFAREVVYAVKTLNTALSNMLLFANSSKPWKKNVRVRELIDDMLDICRFSLRDKDVDIKSFYRDGELSIYADRELIKQVMLNLVMNGVEAVKKRKDGRVFIETYRGNNGVHIKISDNGCGIPHSDIDKIFNPFFTSKTKGTGLGLTVVSNIIRAHGGFIDVESVEGEGTTFDIIFKEEEGDA